VGHAARPEHVVAGARVDPVLADERRDLAVDHVERLVRVVVDVDGGGGSARVADQQLHQAPLASRAGRLDRVAADARAVRPPEVGDALVPGEVRGLLGGGGGGHGDSSSAVVGSCTATIAQQDYSCK
jgi:hypothetical protein